ncbi:MAG: hypothetical protein J6V26_03555 [Alistipes sp.]|nr:hypothetical protein [Alistipes sp.]
MKRFKFIYLLLAVVGVVSFASCQHEYADWAPGAADANAGVYFPDTKNLVVESKDTSVDIPVSRVNAGEALTVSVRSEDVESCGLFTIPASVNFEAGATDSKITITFDGTKLVPGKQYALLIKLSDDESSKYGVSENIFKIGIAEPWKSLGMGTYRDDVFTDVYGIAPGALVPVEVFQHELEPNRYRINPFAASTIPYILQGVPEDIVYGDEAGYLEFIVAEDGVTVTMPADGCPTGFKMDLGSGLENMWVVPYPMDGSAAPGYVEDGVFWFTTPSNMVFMSDSGNGWYANNNGLLAMALPGSEITDYAMGAAYAGMIVEADNKTRYAVVDFTLGVNVETYKFTVLPGNVTEVADTVAAIVAGSEELEIVEAKASQLSWTLSLPEAGVYTIVAVPYGGEEAKTDDALAYAFYFPAEVADIPNAKVTVAMDSVSNLMEKPELEEKYPAGYYAAVEIAANPNEVRSVKMYVSRLDYVVASKMKDEDIIAGYGDDVTDVVLKGLQDEKANGSVILGPFNLQTGSTNVVLVSVETLYGEKLLFHEEYTLPNVSGVELGKYTIAQGDYKVNVEFVGGAKEGIAYFAIDNFEYEGKIDATTKTITFDGYEPYYCDAQNPSMLNTLAFYYDKEQTQVYGFWSASDKDLKEASDLVFSFDEAGVVNALKNYFAMCIHNMDETYSFAKYGFYFTPEATIAKVVEEAPETPETPEDAPAENPEADKARLASVKSLNANLVKASSFNASSFEAKPFDGEVKREMKASVSLR